MTGGSSFGALTRGKRWRGSKSHSKRRARERHSGYGWRPRTRPLPARWSTARRDILSLVPPPSSAACQSDANPGIATLTNRLDWLTDGTGVILPNCFEGRHLVRVASRRNWNDLEDIQVVGHRGAVVVARANPLLIRPPPNPAGNPGRNPRNQKEALVFAVGSLDRQISVWSSLDMHPVAVVKAGLKPRPLLSSLSFLSRPVGGCMRSTPA